MPIKVEQIAAGFFFIIIFKYVWTPDRLKHIIEIQLSFANAMQCIKNKMENRLSFGVLKKRERKHERKK